MYCQCIDISPLHRYIPLYLYLNLATIHSSVSISQPCNNTFHCINISTLLWCIPLHLYPATTTHLQVDSEAPRPILSLQATGKLSLSSQSSSAALMTYPTPGKPSHFPLWTKFPLRLLIFLSTLSLLVIPPIIQNFYRRNQMLSAPSLPVIPPAIATLSLPPWKASPWGVCCLSPDSAGGELLLRRRKSALLQKFSLSERLQTRVRDFLKRF